MDDDGGEKKMIRARRSVVLIFARVLCICTFMTFAFSVGAIDIKIATVAPQGSPWDNALRELAAKWFEISDGSVTIKVYSDGIVGDEPDMLRKMRIGRLDGAAITQLALAEIHPEIMAISTPYLLRSIEEFRFLLASLAPDYESALLEEGFVPVSWAEGGWVHFFASKSLSSPEDLAQLALAVPAGDDEMLQIWRRLGFRAIPLSMNDYAMGLQTGMVTAFYAPPAAVAAFGWYGPISYMNAVRVAPAIGAVVLTEKAWRSVPEEYYAAFRASASEIGDRLTDASIAVESEAIAAMQSQGVVVVESTDSERRAWAQLGISGGDLAVGRLFTAEAYQSVIDLLDSYRGNRENKPASE